MIVLVSEGPLVDLVEDEVLLAAEQAVEHGQWLTFRESLPPLRLPAVLLFH